jgi:hypothetical protein
MTPAIIALILSLLEELIQQEPEIAAQIQAIFAKQNPTPADWLALHQQVLAMTYADYVPASALPAPAAPAATASETATAATATAALVQPASVAAVLPPVTTAAAQSNAPISQTSASEPAYLADGSPNPNFKA